MNANDFIEYLTLLKVNSDKDFIPNSEIYIYVDRITLKCSVERFFRVCWRPKTTYLIVIAMYKWKNSNYTNRSYTTLGFFDNLYKPTEIFLKSWKLKSLIFSHEMNVIYNEFKPVPILSYADKEKICSEHYFSIFRFEEILKKFITSTPHNF